MYKKVVLSLCVLLVFFYAWPQCQKITYRVQFNLDKFISLHGDYEQLYATSPLYRTIKKVKNALPDNATYALSAPSSQFGLKNIAIRYHLYPRTLSPDWAYFIDMDHPGGVHIMAKEGHPWRTAPSSDHGKLLSLNLLLFFCLSLWLAIIGTLILKGYGQGPVQGNRGWFYSSAYLLGLLAFCVPLWGILMLGVRFNQMAVLSLMAFVSLISLFFYKSRVSGQQTAPLDKPRSIDGPKNLAEYSSDAVSLLIIFLFMGIIIAIPVSVWDEMVIWIIKAKSFCAHQGLDFSYTSPAHDYYPLLWPLNIAFYFLMIGDYDEIAKWISALTFFSFLAQLRGCLFFLGIKQALLWPLAALYLVLFAHWTFYTALAENLFMAFLTAMTAWAILWLKDPLHSKKYLMGVLVMATGLTLVKFEGAIAVCLGGLSLFLAYRNIPLNKKDYLFGAWFLMLLVFPWTWSHWVQAQGNGVTWFPMRFAVQNIEAMIKIAADFLIGTKVLLLIAAALLSLTMLGKHRPWTSEVKFLLFWSMALILFSIATGLLWPSYDLKHYPEVFSRLLIRATPALMLIWAIRFYGHA